MLVNILPRINKPPFGSVQVDWGHPLSRGLVAAWVLNEGGGKPFNSVSQESGTLTGMGWSSSGVGSAIKAIVGGQRDFLDTGRTYNAFLNSSRGAVVWRLFPAFGVDAVIRFQWGHQDVSPDTIPEFSGQIAADNNWYVGWNSTGNDNRVVVAATTANLTLNTWQMYILTWDPAGSRFYRDGVLLGTNTTAPVTTSPALTFQWGSANGTSGNSISQNSMIALGYLYGGRSLSGADALWLAIEPYAFLQTVPAMRYWSIPPPSPVSGTYILYLGKNG